MRRKTFSAFIHQASGDHYMIWDLWLVKIITDNNRSLNHTLGDFGTVSFLQIYFYTFLQANIFVVTNRLKLTRVIKIG